MLVFYPNLPLYSYLFPCLSPSLPIPFLTCTLPFLSPSPPIHFLTILLFPHPFLFFVPFLFPFYFAVNFLFPSPHHGYFDPPPPKAFFVHVGCTVGCMLFFITFTHFYFQQKPSKLI